MEGLKWGAAEAVATWCRGYPHPLWGGYLGSDEYRGGLRGGTGFRGGKVLGLERGGGAKEHSA